MNETLRCDYCHDEIEGEPIRRGKRVYCCEACAFEASRSVDCSGRTDSNFEVTGPEAD
ncbi:MAG: TRASH domain-containing protein [Chloroflexi bacterium]|nr:TRASH domain-containing protein [Chloroflexota bacterium]